MGNIIIKPRPERDYYVEWSSIVDAPVFHGPASEYGDEESSRARIGRADASGSSQLDGNLYGWAQDDDNTIIYKQIGTLRLADLEPFCALLASDHKDESPEVLAFITSFKWD